MHCFKIFNSWKVFLFVVFLPIIFLPEKLAIANQEIPVTGESQDPEMEVFDKKLIALMKKWNMPGATVAVVRDGKFIAERGYGWADVEKHKVMEPNNLFRIASLSKTFTAVAILKLVEQKRIKLDDKVFDILDDLKPLPNRQVNPKIYQITVLNLLQMSSGWFTKGAKIDPLFGPWGGKIKEALSPELPASCEAVARYMMSMPLQHKPGTHYAYSNVDYCVLGLVINKVSGSRYGYQGYEDYVNRNILYPINVHDMVIGSTQLQYKLPREVTYYKDIKFASEEELANSFYLPYSNTELLRKNFANGGWVASAEDLAWFVYSLKNGRILGQNSLRLMFQKPPFRAKESTSYYTVGSQVYHDPAGKEYWLQTGSFTGTNAFVITKPNGTVIAIVFNSRPSIFNFLSKFRPELKAVAVKNNL